MAPLIRLLVFLCLCSTLSACLSRPERHARHHPRTETRDRSSWGKGSIPTDASGKVGFGTSSGNLLADYAKLMDTSPMQLKTPELYQFIQHWLGSPHRIGGMMKNGVDCSGFTFLVFSNVYGKILPRTSYDMSLAVQSKKEKKLTEGDLVFFSFGGTNVNHVGIYLQNEYFVHVSTSKGVIISRLTDPWYKKYYVKGGTVL